MKILLWLGLILLVIYVLRKKKADAVSAASARTDAESMARCARCGVHFPASEAVIDADGQVFCSDEHRPLHRSS